MSVVEDIQPPANVDIKEWNRQRREDILKGKVRRELHRTQIDQISNVGKVRTHRLNRVA